MYVFIILQIFFTTWAVWKIGEYSWLSPSFSWGIFGHMHLDQSCMSKNICWIRIVFVFKGTGISFPFRPQRPEDHNFLHVFSKSDVSTLTLV